MKLVVALVGLLACAAVGGASGTQIPGHKDHLAHGKTVKRSVRLHQHRGAARMLNQKPGEEMVHENATAVATQEVFLFNKLDCEGSGANFTFSGNAFLKDFAPYVNNLWSAKVCGKGTFFFFATPDMQTDATLGHITRCGEDVSVDGCACENLPKETRSLVQSFSIQYC
uniref:Uncharacterized protein n=1 Tax=Spumella elongata TaxID=89044 RepID=A0A7S3HG70_9STRA|mmetsp:Transcript_3314/g.12522  ORF Transcript_3314/g.12522 Transcript_3314/m.12522 type:complete len:169 (-) Transcript_3314:135-641(-)